MISLKLYGNWFRQEQRGEGLAVMIQIVSSSVSVWCFWKCTSPRYRPSQYQPRHLRLSSQSDWNPNLGASALDSSCHIGSNCSFEIYILMWFRNGPSTILLFFTWWKTFSSFLPHLFQPACERFLLPKIMSKRREWLCEYGNNDRFRKRHPKYIKKNLHFIVKGTCAHTYTKKYIHTHQPYKTYIQYFHP